MHVFVTPPTVIPNSRIEHISNVHCGVFTHRSPHRRQGFVVEFTCGIYIAVLEWLVEDAKTCHDVTQSVAHDSFCHVLDSLQTTGDVFFGITPVGAGRFSG